MRHPHFVWLVCGVISIGGAGHRLPADEAQHRPPSPPLPTTISPFEGFRQQSTDEPLESFSPRMPETERDRKRAVALAHYMTGRVHQSAGNEKKALQEYLAAIEADPSALEPYQAAIPLMFRENKAEEARDLALRSARFNRNGFELISTLSAVLARQEELDEGIALLQAALKLPSLGRGSAQEYLLRRDLGLYYRLMDDFEKSAAEYKTVFEAMVSEATPEEVRNIVLADPGANFDEFGDVFLKAKQPDLALRAYEEASKYREAKPGLHSYNLAAVFHETGQPERALGELQHYFEAQLQSRGRSAYELLQKLLDELDRGDELIPMLRAQHEKDPYNDVLRYFLADRLLAKEEVDEAATLYTGAQPELTDPRALVGMIGVSRLKRDAEKLLEVLPKTFQTVPRADDDQVLQRVAPDVRDLALRFEAELEALKEDDAAIDGLLSLARERAGDDAGDLDFFPSYVVGKLAAEADRSDDAIFFYRRAISMRNDPPVVLYRELGSHLLDAERHEDAIEILKEAAEHTSDQLRESRWYFLYLLSYAHAFNGQIEEALEDVRSAQQLQPEIPNLAYQEAWVYYHAREWDRALELFEEFIKKHPGEKDLIQSSRFRISSIYVEQGDMARGEAVLQEVLESDPDNTQANNDLGYLWADQGKNLEQARTMIQKALDAEPENPAYLDSMGWVLYRLGETDEAVEYLQKATRQKHGSDSTIYDHLGDALLNLDRKDEARAAFEKALEIEKEKAAPKTDLVEEIEGKLKELTAE